MARLQEGTRHTCVSARWPGSRRHANKAFKLPFKSRPSEPRWQRHLGRAKLLIRGSWLASWKPVRPDRWGKQQCSGGAGSGTLARPARQGCDLGAGVEMRRTTGLTCLFDGFQRSVLVPTINIRSFYKCLFHRTRNAPLEIEQFRSSASVAATGDIGWILRIFCCRLLGVEREQKWSGFCPPKRWNASGADHRSAGVHLPRSDRRWAY